MKNTYEQITNLHQAKKGDHIVLLYQEKEEYISSVIPFIKDSLKREEKCLYIDAKDNIENIKRILSNSIDDLKDYLESNQLQLLTKEQSYLMNKEFDSEKMIKLIKKEINKALKEGYKGLSMTGELAEVLKFKKGKQEIINYEWKLNHRIFDNLPFTALCRYNINKYDPETIKSVIELHPYLIWDDEFHENPYYVNYEGYRDNKIVEFEIKSWLKNIKKYKKKAKKLERTENEYQELFSEAPVGIFRTTSNGGVISVNKTMAEMLGYLTPKEAVSAYNDLKKELYVDSNRRDEFIKKLKNEGKVENFVYEALKKNGDKIYLSMNAKIEEKKKDKFIIKGFVYNITKRKEFQEELKTKKEELQASNEQLSAYNEEIKAMNEELEQSFDEINDLNERFVDMIELVADMEDKTLLNEKEFFAELLENAIEIVPEADYGKICVINEKDKFEIIDGIGHKFELLKDIKIDKALMKDLDKVEAYKSESYCIDYEKLPEEQKENFKKALKPIKHSLNINIKIENKTVAKLTLDIKEDSNEKFSNTTQKILKSFANLAASFFAFKRFDSLKTNFTRELISSIIKILEMYDLYTKGHSENVANIASSIAEKMNFSKKVIKDTYWAGLVHDIGKLLIPVDVLNKKGKLTDDEYELIKKHTIYGKKALSDSESLEHIAKYVLYHHERWDGKGYPKGISGNDIPPISQILAVADSFDAMLSRRAYRDPLSLEKAKKEIKDNSGTQFSPEVAEVFLEMLEENEIEDLKKDNLEIEDEYQQKQEGNKAINKKESFEELFKKGHSAMVIVDKDFKIVKANENFKRMYKFEENNLKGLSIKEIVPEEKIDETEKHIKSIKEEGKIDNKTYRKTKDGEKIDVSVHAFPTILEDGNAGYYVIYEDISELKNMERKFKDIKNRYKLLFENENTVMLIINPENGDIIDANPAAVRFYGWSKDELTSMKITGINTLTENEVKKEMKKAKDENKITFEFKHETVNGDIKDVEVYSHPINFGEDKYLYSIIHDITEKIRAQKQLKKEKEFNQNVLDSLTANIVILDEEGIIKYTNKAWRDFAKNNGIDPKDVGIGKDYLKVLKKAKNEGEEKADKAYYGIKEVMMGNKEKFDLEYPCHSPDEKRWFRMRVSEFEYNGPYSIIIHHQNITKWK